MLRAFENLVNRWRASRTTPAHVGLEESLFEESSSPIVNTFEESEATSHPTEFPQTSFRKNQMNRKSRKSVRKRESGDLSLAYLLVQQSQGEYSLEVASSLPNDTLLSLLEKYKPVDVVGTRDFLKEAQRYDDQHQNSQNKIPSNYGLR